MKTNWTQEEKRLRENGLGEQMARDFIGWCLWYAPAAQREGLDYDAVISAFHAALDKIAGLRASDLGGLDRRAPDLAGLARREAQE